MNKPMLPRVLVLGAGIVGVSCALALQRRGWSVTLVDRRSPGEETSHGNAGVIARSSLIPFNHPALWRALPRLLQSTSNSFRYAPTYLRRNLHWAARFLLHARPSTFDHTTRALDALIRHSMNAHRVLRTQAGVDHRYRESGWIYGYRDDATFAAGQWQRAVWRKFGVDAETLDGHGLRALEPALAPMFTRAVWVRDAWSVDDPGAVVKAFAELFRMRGGVCAQSSVDRAEHVRREGDGWDTPLGHFDHLVVALGPWSAAFLRAHDVQVPMAFERGYHQHVRFADSAPDAPRLTRPFYDVSAGYVASPMAGGVRVTTGVELNALDAPPNHTQMSAALRAVSEALPVGEATLSTPWSGARPTLPDSRPMIGRSARYPTLWLAFGHQHIGFSTGPGTGDLLAALMLGEPTPIDPAPFAPSRWGI
jgi:D-amino-acid dehydrogenase